MGKKKIEWTKYELRDLRYLLRSINFLQSLTEDQFTELTNAAESFDIDAGADAFTQGKETQPALYIIRKGRCWIKRENEADVAVLDGCQFGQELLELGEGKDSGALVIAPFTVQADPRNEVECARLTLEACRKIFEIDAVDKSSNMYVRQRRTSDHPANLTKAICADVDEVPPASSSFSKVKKSGDKEKKKKKKNKDEIDADNTKAPWYKAKKRDSKREEKPAYAFPPSPEPPSAPTVSQKPKAPSAPSPPSNPASELRRSAPQLTSAFVAASSPVTKPKSKQPTAPASKSDSGSDLMSTVPQKSKAASVLPPMPVPEQRQFKPEQTPTLRVAPLPIIKPAATSATTSSTTPTSPEHEISSPLRNKVLKQWPPVRDTSTLSKGVLQSPSNTSVSPVKAPAGLADTPVSRVKAPASPACSPVSRSNYLASPDKTPVSSLKALNKPASSIETPASPRQPIAPPPQSPSTDLNSQYKRNSGQSKYALSSPSNEHAKNVVIPVSPRSPTRWSPYKQTTEPDAELSSAIPPRPPQPPPPPLVSVPPRPPQPPQAPLLSPKSVPKTVDKEKNLPVAPLDSLKTIEKELTSLDLPKSTSKTVDKEKTLASLDLLKNTTKTVDKEKKKEKKEKKEKKSKKEKEKKHKKEKKEKKSRKKEVAETPDESSSNNSSEEETTRSGVHRTRAVFDANNMYGLSPVKTRAQLVAESIESANITAPIRPPPNVFQKPLVLQNNYKAPVIEKTKEERSELVRALSKVFATKNGSKQTVNTMIDAFERSEVEEGTELVSAGKPNHYFYVVGEGELDVEIKGQNVGKVKKGEHFGEMNLLMNAPAGNLSVRAGRKSVVFRIDQTTFRSIAQDESQKEIDQKLWFIDSIKYFERLSDYHKRKLANVMQGPIEFKKGETIVVEADYGINFYIITDGKVQRGNRVLEKGGHFGESALVKSESRPCDVLALSDGSMYAIDQKTFERVLGPTNELIVSPIDLGIIAAIESLQFEEGRTLTIDQCQALISKMTDQKYKKGETVLNVGAEVLGALYFVRKGRVNQVKGRVGSMIGEGSVFGHDLFFSAKLSNSTFGSVDTPVVADTDCTVSQLKIQDYYAIKKSFSPKEIKKAQLKAKKAKMESITKVRVKMSQHIHGDEASLDSEDSEDENRKHRHIPFHNLDKKVCLGEGMFGQVWMVYDRTEKNPVPYALKIQSKYQLVEEEQAEAVIREKEAMARLKHPFIIRLMASYQDEHFVYMLLTMVQGGELFNLIHPIDEDISRNGLPLAQAKFYAFTIADAIAYLHGKRYVYRDLKPENILIDAQGYPVLIDFGFAKRIVTVSHTLCGTPGYLPPEMCLSKPHSFSADHWSFGVLVYEMLCGYSPFFYPDIDQRELYRSIIEDEPEHLPAEVPEVAVSLVLSLLTKKPELRLGSLAGGENDILNHAWFAGMDVKEHRRKNVAAPWKPKIKDAFDTSNFDDWSELDDKTDDPGPTLREADAAVFLKF
jgi:CRP-like cAMP-binding protein